jgi:hypothetical protein
LEKAVFSTATSGGLELLPKEVFEDDHDFLSKNYSTCRSVSPKFAICHLRSKSGKHIA